MSTTPLHEAKIKTREELADRLRALKSSGSRIGFTSGVFDLVHPGHVAYLESAKLECDLLVVGINSDRSVRQNKGDLRPICGERERAQVIAGLGSVDFVFIFDEKNNNRNIELLKPDAYVKAGDYDRAKLSSAALVEAYGGKVVLVPFAEGHGTTGVIERIAARYSAEAIPSPYPAPRPAVFLDRDGTLNEHVEYLHETEKLTLIPGVLEALKRLKDHGFRLVVVTNQPGIGMGYFSKEDFFVLNRTFLTAVRQSGVTIDRVYFCPHTDNDRCACRKPGTALIERAVKELNIDLDRSFVVGDMTGDVMLGKNAGCRTVLVETGMAGADKRYAAAPDFQAKNLLDAVDYIISTTGPIGGEMDAAAAAPPKFDLRERFIRSKVLETVGSVTGKIGHDLNNYLGAIQGSLDIVNARVRKLFPAENPLQQPLALMAQSLEGGEALTRKLRGYVRPGEAHLNPIDLAVIAQELGQRLRSAAPAGVSVAVKGPPSLRLLGDEFGLTEVLFAIGVNALEAVSARPGGAITIEVREEVLPGDATVLSRRCGTVAIGDNGPGITESQRGELFTPKSPRTGSAPGGGYGLALPMADELLIRCGGELHVDSTPQGTVVTVRLPLRQ